jgi:hypothetical protein
VVLSLKISLLIFFSIHFADLVKFFGLKNELLLVSLVDTLVEDDLPVTDRTSFSFDLLLTTLFDERN